MLVIGMGLAGTAAAKEAAEAGKKVIVLEKQPEESYAVISMAGDFGVVGSQIQKNLGIEWAPKEDILNEFVKETGGRCDTWMINYWYDHSGEDFDWFIENADYEVLESTAADRKTDKENYIRPKCFPKLETYNYKEELYPYFHGTITTNPNMQWACQAAFNDAVGSRRRTHLRGGGRTADRGRIRRGHGRLRQDAERIPEGERQGHGHLLWRLRRKSRNAPLLRPVDRRVRRRRRRRPRPADGHLGGRLDGARPARAHDAPHGRIARRGQLPAAEHGRPAAS